MGRRNKVVKLTAKKVGYINRAKIRNDSNRNIARDMKLSVSAVKFIGKAELRCFGLTQKNRSRGAHLSHDSSISLGNKGSAPFSTCCRNYSCCVYIIFYRKRQAVKRPFEVSPREGNNGASCLYLTDILEYSAEAMSRKD